ncbi:hypothetical protein J5N97_000932 [Dioscorea zingiberensis]|uniref:RWP-RK domain-containing protein n=1 Tax=Dioscorea zingiberensis TaxID=325984 RepID=A0A9D5BUL9_9LILI|nr:hypothetical protein J5N97_000932 [Dioscorea zingiberensis]
MDYDQLCSLMILDEQDQLLDLTPFLSETNTYNELPIIPSLDANLEDIDLDSLTWDDNIVLPCYEDVVAQYPVPLNIIPNDIKACVIRDEENVIKKSTTGSVIRPSRSKIREIGYSELKKYFYMPIASAAKEMNVGLTVLKKRCRELGIARWPHRKMKSLNSLIHNVKEFGKDEGSDEIIGRELKTLEEQQRLMEENPEMEMNERTKKLRQACFKANYKKRKAMQSPNCIYHHPDDTLLFH